MTAQQAVVEKGAQSLPFKSLWTKKFWSSQHNWVNLKTNSLFLSVSSLILSQTTLQNPEGEWMRERDRKEGKRPRGESEKGRSRRSARAREG
jgi:hypothetical protein